MANIKKIKQAKGKDLENMKTAYEAVLSTHDAISNFRLKLLALLPFATGAGIFFLIKNLPSTVTIHLTAIVLSGMLVTIGLFFYELKNIQKCRTLITTGKLLEKKLLGDYCELGAFHGGRIADKKWLEGIEKKVSDSSNGGEQKHKNLNYKINQLERIRVTNTRAALFVYVTAVAGWAFLSTYGLADNLLLQYPLSIGFL